VKVPILQTVKQAIRQPHTMPGMYPLYTVTNDGELLCADCARKEYSRIARSTRNKENDGFCACGVIILWEGEEVCCNCYATLPSAYGTELDL
jgi:hypothetical protein